jgi:hypothetical protein
MVAAKKRTRLSLLFLRGCGVDVLEFSWGVEVLYSERVRATTKVCVGEGGGGRTSIDAVEEKKIKKKLDYNRTRTKVKNATRVAKE